MDQGELNGRLALITGATGGIGRATCEVLAAQGCHVAIHYHRANSVAAELVAELTTSYKTLGVKAASFQADLSNYSEVRRLHAEVAATLGDPDVLFNNAGLNLGKVGVKGIEELSVDEFEYTWRANCGQAFLLTQLCMPAMVDRAWGRLIFCSSEAGITGGVVGPHYA
ncbi:hypothetical protein MMC10_009057 [Thelotrema lepadinum]|nr:hypothetical protein [Thelotrema lepadinum]